MSKLSARHKLDSGYGRLPSMPYYPDTPGLPTSNRLIEMAQGADPTVVPALRKNAVRALAVIDDERTTGVLAAIVTNSQEERSLRAAAASSLGHHAGTQTEEALLAVLATEDPLLRYNAVKSLGQVGGRGALEALRALPTCQDSGFVSRQMSFAQALIAYRIGSEHDPLPRINPARAPFKKSDPSVDIRIDLIDSHETAARRGRLTTSDYSVPLAPLGIALRCGGVPGVVFLNEAVAGSQFDNRPVERRLIAGLVAVYHELTETYAVMHLILARPEDESYRIAIIRWDGVPSYAGKATHSRGGIAFDIAHVAGSTAPEAAIKGWLTREQIELEQAVVSTQRRNRHRAKRLSSSPTSG